MSYAAISSRRMPYDVDGTAVGCGKLNNGILQWLTSQQMQTLNTSDAGSGSANVYGTGDFGPAAVCWMFFPEKREIEQIWGYGHSDVLYSLIKAEGSNDTTNGLDGTWEVASLSANPSYGNDYSWRSGIVPVSFSTSYRVIRVTMSSNGSFGSAIGRLHLYGCKASGETPDDVIFCNSDGDEITALKDWGDRPEGTVLTAPFYIKNTSSSKVANNINIQLNDRDFLLSLDQSQWQATLNLSSLDVGQVSAPIYVKNTIGNPNQTLGPRAARAIVTVTSWQ